MSLPVYQNLDGVNRAAAGGAAVTAWADAVNDDMAYVFGEVAWTPFTFSNGWANFGAGADTAGFRQVGNTVKLRGLISGGAVNAVALTLPVGYRPTGVKFFAVDSNSAFGKVTISTTGAVVLVVGSNVYASLDGIEFDIT
jgi:hypothetical protein